MNILFIKMLCVGFTVVKMLLFLRYRKCPYSVTFPTPTML